MRKVSKKIMFVDIIVEEEKNSGIVEQHRQTLLLKFWERPELRDRCTRGVDKVHVGDVIEWSGVTDDQFFVVQTYSFLTRWSDVSSQPFKPLPPEQQQKQLTNHTNNDAREKRQCKFFVNTGQCAVENCRFSHDEGPKLAEARQRFLTAKQQRREQLIHERSTDLGEVQSSCKRAELFAEWIRATYGSEYLANQTVLDIAGGRGDLAFELAVKSNVDCQVVDPRPRKLKRWQSKLLKKEKIARLPAHHQSLFDTEFFKKSAIQPENVSLVTGLHPDEATEPIVDTALYFQLPFAVLPCCVFSALFPDRRLSDGSVPTTYDQFCTYLMEKSDTIRSVYLPFLGRNRVLYTLPTTSSSLSSEATSQLSAQETKHTAEANSQTNTDV